MLTSFRLGIKFKGELVLLLVVQTAHRTLLMRYADGNHRVPNVNRNSDGDFNFNLGNFENDWDDDNCLLCYCNSNDFSRYLLAGVLSDKFFFQPPSMRPTSSNSKISAP